MPEADGDWPLPDFDRHGRDVLDTIHDYFAGIRQTPVAGPHDRRQLVDRLLTGIPEHGQEFDGILADTRDKIIPELLHWNHPRFHGYFPTCASLPGVLAETMTAALNVNAMLWRTSPAASALETVVLRWLAELCGYPPDADGLLLAGASPATLYALAAAREESYAAAGHDVRTHGLNAPGLPVGRVYTSDQAHSSVDKAALTLGIGLANVVRVPSDAHYRMRPEALEEALTRDIAAGARPLAVVATVGTTSTGAADPLRAVAAVCRRHGVWLHVDAAYGGFYPLAPSLAGRLEDVAVGDSLVVNPQKTLFVPLDSTALYCRRPGALANTFRLVPEYLAPAHGLGPGEEGDFMDLSPQLGRGFRALKLWWVIRSFGRRGLAARLEKAVRLAEDLRRRVREHPDWRCVADSVYPLLCLRYEPAPPGGAGGTAEDRARLDRLNAAVLEAVNASGEAFVSHSVIREGYVIRVSIGNIRTTEEDVAALWRLLTETGERERGAMAPVVRAG
ncbi:PLP-dependent decarboxylase [Streptomyces carpaticus]|uniref:pyridoxal phosphate-dependent decarboxylase family protein n=1 Tax=Streptomyces TaxID=1883 RepID=UPI002203F54F|nr:PLP-dependent decarboxylase [Streptomyces carpaticus]